MTTDSTIWQPRFKLDLKLAKAKHLAELVIEFERWCTVNPIDKSISLNNGWYEVTPQLAENFLSRNPAEANRKLVFATVVYYAAQMQRADWQKTGQPLIFTTDGILLDGQHRLWAAYLSEKTFTTYIVSDVEPQPLLFAYVDNSKARTPADALSTAGMNGQSGIISKILRMIELYEHDCYSPTKIQKLPRLTPIEYVHFGKDHPRLPQAVLLMASDYDMATRVIAHRDVAGFAALYILEIHGETVCDDFMGEIGTHNDDPESPIAAFQELMRKDRDKKYDRLKSHIVLAYLIKTFNSWLAKEPVKKLSLRVNEQYPRFAAPQSFAEAAE
jgi:hypothetical protein